MFAGTGNNARRRSEPAEIALGHATASVALAGPSRRPPLPAAGNLIAVDEEMRLAAKCGAVRSLGGGRPARRRACAAGPEPLLHYRSPESLARRRSRAERRRPAQCGAVQIRLAHRQLGQCQQGRAQGSSCSELHLPAGPSDGGRVGGRSWRNKRPARRRSPGLIGAQPSLMIAGPLGATSGQLSGPK